MLRTFLLRAAWFTTTALISLPAGDGRRRRARAPGVHVAALRRCGLLPVESRLRGRDHGRRRRPIRDGSFSQPLSTAPRGKPARRVGRVSALRSRSRNFLCELVYADYAERNPDFIPCYLRLSEYGSEELQCQATIAA